MSDEERWMQTFTGKGFPLETFNPDVIHIEDIAHALGMLCRFNGQCKTFHSVAEHSVHVSYEIAPDLALLGLMHDTAEVYLGDVSTPLKKELSAYREKEDKLMKLIGGRFGFVFLEKGTVEEVELKRADRQLLADEKEVVMGPECKSKPWPGILEVKNPDRIECWASQEEKIGS
jgi:5'-nucleotidase